MNYSRQRQAIMDFLCDRKDHPTADTVYRNIRKTIPSISLGTVYRNLNLLAEHGTIRRVRGIDGSEHFDADITDHQHFICRCCGIVEDILLPDRQMSAYIKQEAQKCFAGKIETSDLYFLGLCCSCCKKQ